MASRKARVDKPFRSGTHAHGWKPGPCRTCRAWCAGCGQCGCQADAAYGAAVRTNLAQAQAQLKGKAFGGPRDGVIIQASGRWDGVLEKHREEGRYKWAGKGWQWHPAAPTRASRRSHRKKADK